MPAPRKRPCSICRRWFRPDVKNELPVSALIEKLAVREASHGKPAEDERTRAETQCLIGLRAFDSNQLNSVRLPNLLFGDDELGMKPMEDRAGPLHGRLSDLGARGYTNDSCTLQ